VKEERLYQILVSPHVSEKASAMADESRHVAFVVRPDATKTEIRAAVEKLFSVEVEAVQVVNMRGKMKRFGKTPGKRNNWKKAYVQLKPGHDIDFVGT